jgi:hypothetical protein
MQRTEAVADLLDALISYFFQDPGDGLPDDSENSGENGEEEVPYLLDLPTVKVAAGLQVIEDEAILKELAADEQSGKNRKTVLSAIAKRINELAEVPHPEVQTETSGENGEEDNDSED